MFNYKIACSDYGEYSCFELTHDEKFSKHEFHQMVQEAIKKAYESMDCDERAIFDRISFLFLDYRFVCQLHKMGFKNLEFQTAIELDNANITDDIYPICGPVSFIDAEMDDCDVCENQNCGFKNDSLNVICSEFGPICIKGDLND